ncbi:MAG TPA: T9SS type A sorting domain-containing protein [Ignavibacteria bacterium]|nr:T9SS type A sorting domain-containing protein [Ignavibacteria bacterium]HRJ99113.1 T9SS type A sorting domain-containing protein [Ignavibacteria bacterium]
MKKIIYGFFAAVILLAVNFHAAADGLNSVHTSNGIFVVAAGNQGNILFSNSSGSTWSKTNAGPVNFKSVFTLGTAVWYTSSAGKVYTSTTAISDITERNTGVSTSINSIYFTGAANGFICGDNGVVMKSADGGITWTPSAAGISSVNLNSISFKDATNGVTVGDNGKVFVTTNGGALWTEETVNTSRDLLSAKYFPDGIGITGEWGVVLFKPSGSTWEMPDMKIKSDITGIDGDSFNDIHVCGGGGFIRNNINGNTGFLNFEKNPMLADLTDMVRFSGLGFAVSSMNNAVIRTTNGGTTWALPSGTTVTYNWVSKPGAGGDFLGNNMSLHPTDRNAIFIAFGNRVYRSNNKAETWSVIGNQVPTGFTPHSFFVSPNDTNIWLIAIESSPDKIYRTTNYGQTWTEVMSRAFSNYGQPLEMDQNNPSVFYFAPDNGGFWKSTDDGATWNEISNNYPFRSPCDIIVMYDSSNVIFVADGITGSGQAIIFKSVNGGVNWTNVHTANSSEIPSMSNSIFDKSVIWATEWSGSRIYKSTNYGDSFFLSHQTGFSGWGSDVCKEDPDLIVTGSWGAAATMSLDGGVTWTNISQGLSGHGGGILIPDRGYIVCHQGSNVYKLNIVYDVITEVSENIISSVPADYSLSQNYPNPFNPSTKIKYTLPKPDNVTLKIYNELGKEVTSLADGFKNAGTYEITFDGNGLPSGVYFYKIQTSEYTSARKMLLIK